MFDTLFDQKAIIERLPTEVQLIVGVKLTPEQLSAIPSDRVDAIKTKFRSVWGVDSDAQTARASKPRVVLTKPKAVDLCKAYIDSLSDGARGVIRIRDLRTVTKYTNDTLRLAMKDLGYFYCQPRSDDHFFTKNPKVSRAERYRLILKAVIDILEEKGTPTTKKLVVHELIKRGVVDDEKVQRQSVYNVLLKFKRQGIITADIYFNILSLDKQKFSELY